MPWSYLVGNKGSKALAWFGLDLYMQVQNGLKWCRGINVKCRSEWKKCGYCQYVRKCISQQKQTGQRVPAVCLLISDLGGD